MSRRAARFTQADVARAIRAVDQVAAGRWRVRVAAGGEIIVEPVTPGAEPAPEPEPVAPAKDIVL